MISSLEAARGIRFMVDLVTILFMAERKMTHYLEKGVMTKSMARKGMIY